MTRKKGALLIGGLLGFAIIAYFVVSRDTLKFDTVVAQWFYSIRNPILTPVIKCITFLGNWQSITLICILLLFFKESRRKYGYAVSVAAILISFLNKGVKLLFERPRPDASLHLIEQGGFSFTSGHSITSLVVFGMLIYLVRNYVQGERKKNWLTILLCIPLICVGLSRIYLGVHYPSDVLGGWCLGISVLIVLTTIEKKIQKIISGRPYSKDDFKSVR